MEDYVRNEENKANLLRMMALTVGSKATTSPLKIRVVWARVKVHWTVEPTVTSAGRLRWARSSDNPATADGETADDGEELRMVAAGIVLPECPPPLYDVDEEAEARRADGESRLVLLVLLLRW